MELITVDQVAQPVHGTRDLGRCRLALVAVLRLVAAGHEASDHRAQRPDAERGFHPQDASIIGRNDAVSIRQPGARVTQKTTTSATSSGAIIPGSADSGRPSPSATSVATPPGQPLGQRTPG